MGGSVFAVAALLLMTVQSDVRADSEELERRVKPGANVFVIDTTGAERAGTAAEVAGRGITLLQTSGARFTVPLESIERVERTDSLWNGFLIGAALVPTLYAIGAAGDAVSWTTLIRCSRLFMRSSASGATGCARGARLFTASSGAPASRSRR
jgi:hypothetical protein